MEAREHCYACDKVACLCLCESVARVHNRTGITIVQHPREARHPLGTVRIARLGLDNLTVHVTGRGSRPPPIPKDAALLFPDPSAPLLSALPTDRRPAHLVVIDGTWGHAGQLRRRHPALASLPAVRLAPETPSRYRIRAEPHAQAVSTIEAIVRALETLEPDTEGLDGLLSSFDEMIDEHLEQRVGRPSTPRHRHTPRVHKPVPEVFRGTSRDVVLVYAELHQPRGQRSRFPLRVTAARADPRELVDVFVDSPLPPSEPRVKNMGLGPLSFSDAIAPDALAERLRCVIRPSDTVVAWAQRPGTLLHDLGFEQPFFSAKRHFARNRTVRVGSIDDVVAALDDSHLEPWAPGRAGLELAKLHRVISAMRARA